METNEIFLLIAVWLARILKQEHHYFYKLRHSYQHDHCDGSRNGDATETVDATTAADNDDKLSTTAISAIPWSQPCYEYVASPMTDFCMIPWWDVARNEIMAKYHLSSATATASSESSSLENAAKDADELDKTLRRLCGESFAYLNRAWAETFNDSIDDGVKKGIAAPSQNNGSNKNQQMEDNKVERTATTASGAAAVSALFPPPPYSSDDAVKTWLSPKGIALLIGSLEQNCLGVRRKHPIQYNILHNDDNIRQRFHTEIIQCLENAGMIGYDDDEQDSSTDRMNAEAKEQGEVEGMKESVSPSPKPCIQTNQSEDVQDFEGQQGALPSQKEEWDYSYDEINEFLANMMGDNVFSVGKDDEWDDIFHPFDGTAHFSMISKMNHSCEPNIVVLYKTSGWGRNHPLVAYCVALRDISEGEELTISYIDTDANYLERQLALANYGFQCKCAKCENERDGTMSAIGNGQDMQNHDADSNIVLGDEDDLFGDDSDNDESKSSGDEVDSTNNGHKTLEDMAESVESYLNHSDVPLLPVNIVAPAFNYVLKTASAIVSSFQNDYGISGNEKSREDTIQNILNGCIHAAESRDFSSCRIVGPDLEEFLLHRLLVDGSWPDVRYRGAYFCASATAAIGYARECSFLVAMQYLDKAAILGLRRADIEAFFAYVELFSFQMASGPYPLTYQYDDIPMYRKDETQESFYLGRSIESPVDEISFHSAFCFQDTLTTYHSTPLVIRGVAINWPAATRWRSLDYIVKSIGRRLVPIEIGGMSTSHGMKESIMEVREFVECYLWPSTERSMWNLDDATDKDNLSHIAYLAQHPLLDQITFLYDDVHECPLGVKPTDVNVWIGTGGTRTPLHFDSYDNFLVQIAGIKLVRLYHPSDTSNLYVSKASTTTRKDCEKDRRRHDLQGNMSAVDCEIEDFEIQPLAKDCAYYETLLFPGDVVFIPSGHWHYVRSLTTSISVNYWF